VSIGKGVHHSVERAVDLDLESFQIFTASQKRWLPGTIGGGEAALFKELQEASGLPFIVHAGYLPNLANPDDDLFKRSVDSLVQEMSRCSSLDAPYLVMHPGSHKGSGFDAGLRRVAEGIGAVRDALSDEGSRTGAMVLFENVAGGPSAMGARFEHLARLMDAVPVAVGLCLDTCHAHAAGYDLAREGGMADTIDEIDSIIGLERLRAVHLNDCRSPMGSGVDRHSDILDGTMGGAPFKVLMNEGRLRRVPMVMETPGGDGSYRRDLSYLRSLRV
jgi:deoxyribonuclease-4